MITLPQTIGLRGNAAPWRPSSLGASLWAWYDATQQGGSDGVAVSQVTDYSGNARHLTSSTAWPVYRATAFSGSKPCFDCIGSKWAEATISYTGSSMSFIFVWRYQNSPSGNGRVLSFRAASNDWGEVGGGIALYVGGTSAVAMRGGTTQTVATGLSSGTPMIVCNAMSNGSFTVHKDGTQTAGSPTAMAAGNFAAQRLWFGGSNAEFCNGYIAEAFLVSSAISASDREKAEGYLAHKYSLTSLLPVSHPYKTAAP